MTRTDLEQIYYLHRELRMWERELERLRGRSLVQSPHPTLGPQPNASHGSGVSDKVADRAAETADLERLIAAKRDEIQELRDKAVAYIYGIPDSLTRQVVYYRCVSLFSWRRVAYEVGGNNTEESVKKHYYRFFESCPECPD